MWWDSPDDMPLPRRSPRHSSGAPRHRPGRPLLLLGLAATALLLLLAAHAAAQEQVFWAGDVPTTRPPSQGTIAVFSNGGPFTETVEVSTAAGPVTTLTVPPFDSVTFQMSDRFDTSDLRSAGVYRFAASSSHVVASTIAPANFVSMDAARLIPERQLGTEHYVFAYQQEPTSTPTFPHQTFVLIVATQDNTEVQVRPTRATQEGPGGMPPAMTPGVTYTFTLDRYEGLNVMGAIGHNLRDLTGTRVVSDKPVAVFSGSQSSHVPDGAGDHLHDQATPTTFAGTEFLVCSTVHFRTGGPDPVDLVRVMAAEAGITTVTRTGGPPIVLNGAGDYGQFLARADTVLSSNRPVLVGMHPGGDDGSTDKGAFVHVLPLDLLPERHTVYHEPGGVNGRLLLGAAATPGLLDINGAAPSLSWRTVGSDGHVCADTSSWGGTHLLEADSPFQAFAYDARSSNHWFQRTDVSCLLGATPPGPPQNLRATPVPGSGGTEVDLTWEPPEDDGGCPVEAYIIQHHRQGTGVWAAIATLDAGTLDFKHSGLDVCRVHDWAVLPVTRAGVGGSAMASHFHAVSPGAPHSLQVEPRPAGADMDVELTWQPPLDAGSCPLWSYQVHRHGGGGTVLVAEVPAGGERRHWDRLPEPCVQVTYTVVAVTAHLPMGKELEPPPGAGPGWAPVPIRLFEGPPSPGASYGPMDAPGHCGPDADLPVRDDQDGDGAPSNVDPCPPGGCPGEEADAEDGDGVDGNGSDAAPVECPVPAPPPLSAAAVLERGVVRLSWDADAACPPESFVVWVGAGDEVLGMRSGVAGQAGYALTDAEQRRGEVVYWVQSLDGGEGMVFDASRAVATDAVVRGLDPLRDDPACPECPDGDGVDRGDTAGGPDSSAPLTAAWAWTGAGLLLVLLAAAGLAAFAWRRRRRD